MPKSKTDWVVVGGKHGETAHCTRCGEGLTLGPQPIYIWTAATEAFIKEHARCKPGSYHETPTTTPLQWFLGRDTGTSSLAIFEVMTGTKSPHRSYSFPLDPDDFGRCYRLLNLFPEYRLRLPEVAERFPAWRPMVARWDEMTALYEEELPRGTAPKLYELMQELRPGGLFT
jgi:hypothetical protein